jgi:hypothetical protein
MSLTLIDSLFLMSKIEHNSVSVAPFERNFIDRLCRFSCCSGSKVQRSIQVYPRDWRVMISMAGKLAVGKVTSFKPKYPTAAFASS